jgi:outer membrane protein OmpA-like peptidoglycan-associated protein
MRRCALRSGAGGVTLALLAACAATPPATVVLLPGPDGRTGSVVVSDGRSETVLDTPYASARASGNQPIERRTTSEQEVKKQFGTTLASLPPRPSKYTLYFLSGTDEFTEDTKKEVQQVLAEVAQRPAAEVVVIGHTDRVGGELENDKLSLQRARRVKTLLIPLGIPEDRIVTAGRGEREPVVFTADNVDEPKNRRVEINVR